MRSNNAIRQHRPMISFCGYASSALLAFVRPGSLYRRTCPTNKPCCGDYPSWHEPLPEPHPIAPASFPQHRGVLGYRNLEWKRVGDRLVRVALDDSAVDQNPGARRTSGDRVPQVRFVRCVSFRKGVRPRHVAYVVPDRHPCGAAVLVVARYAFSARHILVSWRLERSALSALAAEHRIGADHCVQAPYQMAEKVVAAGHDGVRGYRGSLAGLRGHHDILVADHDRRDGLDAGRDRRAVGHVRRAVGRDRRGIQGEALGHRGG